MANDANYAGAPRFRQRKISLKQLLRILPQSDLPANAEDVRGDLLGILETGVDKNEEDERHLQAVLSASGTSSSAFIPTPKASKKWEDYASFYKPGWKETESYIRSSATVEDAQGNEYNMDETDKAFLDDFNSKRTDQKSMCTEDEFELICTLVDSVVAEKQPFLSTDPEKLLQWNELEKHITARLEERKRDANNALDLERLLQEAKSPDYASKLVGSPHRSPLESVKLFGSAVYVHWRERKMERKGKSIFPSLKFESGLASDDSDPYVCFRHREVRHSRKTRRTDQQNSGRLRKLHSEMHEAQSIFQLILDRERKRLAQIQTDLEVFEVRCRVKALKRKLKVGAEADDVELLVSVPKRVRQEEQARLRREDSERQRRAQLAQEKLEREKEKREAAREAHREQSREPRASLGGSTAATEARKSTTVMVNGSRIPDLDRLTVEQQFAEREAACASAVAGKLREREEADHGWINSFDSPNTPFVDFYHESFASLEEFNPRANAYGSDVGYNAKPDGSAELGRSSESGSDQLLSPVSLRAARTPTPDPEATRVNLGHWDLEDLGFRSHETRLALPTEAMSGDPPEILEFAGRAESDFNEIDFLQQPSKFSVPRDCQQALCRLRKFRNVTYVDRILPPPESPLTSFAKGLTTSGTDSDERLHDRFKFDNDYEDTTDCVDQLSDDPARLNGVSPMTQNLRFGSMLTAKAFEFLIDAQNNRRKIVQTMVKRQQIQAQQRALAEAQAQQNAQIQSQNNLRMQQGQRAAQRQQQRRNNTSGQGRGKTPQLPSAQTSAAASPAAPGGGKAAAAQSTPKTPYLLKSQGSTTPGNSPNVSGKTPGASGAKVGRDRDKWHGGDKAKDKSNDKDLAERSSKDSSHDKTEAADRANENNGRLTPQPRKVEASV